MAGRPGSPVMCSLAHTISCHLHTILRMQCWTKAPSQRLEFWEACGLCTRFLWKQPAGWLGHFQSLQRPGLKALCAWPGYTPLSLTLTSPNNPLGQKMCQFQLSFPWQTLYTFCPLCPSISPPGKVQPALIWVHLTHRKKPSTLMTSNPSLLHQQHQPKLLDPAFPVLSFRGHLSPPSPTPFIHSIYSANVYQLLLVSQALCCAPNIQKK